MVSLGTTYIYVDETTCKSIYETLCGKKGYIDVDGHFYVKKEVANRVGKAEITFTLGTQKYMLPGTIALMEFSRSRQASMGAFQGKLKKLDDLHL